MRTAQPLRAGGVGPPWHRKGCVFAYADDVDVPDSRERRAMQAT
jgi:hypothetical protein